MNLLLPLALLVVVLVLIARQICMLWVNVKRLRAQKRLRSSLPDDYIQSLHLFAPTR